MPIVNVKLNQNDSFGSNFNLSNSDLILTGTSFAIRSTLGKTRGKWYWEVKLDSGGYVLIGIASKLFPISSGTTGSTGDALYIRAYFGQTATIHPEGLPYGTTIAAGDVIGVAMDLDIGTLEFFKNGGSMGISHNNLKLLGEVFPFFKSTTIGSKKITVNFGNSPFSYSVPNGYLPYAFYSYNKFLILTESGEAHSLSFANEYVSFVPFMTSNSTPIGNVTVSSASGTNSGYKAFDGILTGNGWIANGITNQWLAYKSTQTKQVSKYALICTYSVDSTPRNWELQGSNDELNWVTLDTQREIRDWVLGQKKEFLVDPSKIDSYLAYRIFIYNNNGSNSYISIGEFEMYEDWANQYIIIDPTVDDYVKKGMNKKTSIDLSKNYSTKVYVQKKQALLGSGRVFKQTIDTSKVPIEKVSIE